MAETVILQAPVAIVTIYENTARTSGRTFWNVVIDNKDKFTAFGRELVARFIDGRTPNKIPGRDGAPDSLVYNFSPPLTTILFFEAKSTGKVLCSPPDGTPVPPVTQAAAAPPAATAAPAAAATKAPEPTKAAAAAPAAGKYAEAPMLADLVKDGKLPAVKSGRERLVKRSDLLALVEAES